MSQQDFIPYGKQTIEQDDIDSVVACLQSDFLTQGPQVPAFEQAVADLVQAKFAIAVNSATSALHLACLALDLGAGDWLWTTPNTFVASANCGLYCGAQVDFVDIDSATYNISVAKLGEKLALAQQQNRLPKVLVVVHFAGQSCEMQQIFELSKIYGFRIIEDASHAIGGEYLQQKIGNCRFSDLTVFSFHPVKIITTAEGGLLTTNQPEIASKLALLRSHGITRDSALISQNQAWFYEQQALGFNYRITDLQAALGLSQLQKITRFIASRRALAARYNQAFAAAAEAGDLTLPFQHPDTNSAWHLYPILVNPANREQIFNQLRAQNIGVNVHYIPVHWQPFYQQLGFKTGDFPAAENYYQATISLPLHPNLTEQQQDFVNESVLQALKN